ncbi:UNVERIFIED_CONTAM: hypothetical protein GTU68_000265 [Idotea baltica]|nr:hypothetical protein [Idotea baltica]
MDGTVLVADDDRTIRTVLTQALTRAGCKVRSTGSVNTLWRWVEEGEGDAIVSDVMLPDGNGLELLPSIKRKRPELPVIVISAQNTVMTAIKASESGAYDYLPKPFDLKELLSKVNKALSQGGPSDLRNNLDVSKGQDLPLIGSAPAMQEVYRLLARVLNTDLNVMISGPSGAGKEVAARYIHANSDRASGPFVTVNSASIEPERMEEVLFGRESTERGYEPGLLDQAHGGILYFDEIADMPVGTQSKILRVLLEQQFTRVGGKDKVRVDIRVLSSTNRDLLAEIDAGNFREELYHRLNVVPIEVPSLESRRDDIPAIARHFVEELNKEQGLTKREISNEACAVLQMQSWPGNIRQLRNVIERILILGPNSGPIMPDELPNAEPAQQEENMGLTSNFASLSLRDAREMFEREYLMVQINRFGGNISKTATFVGMERSALHRKLKTLNVVTTNKSGARVAELEAVATGTDG